MKNVIIALISLGLAGCYPKEFAPNENAEALHEKFHGKYKAIRSVSSEPLDVNLDGQASTDMLVEIPDLTLNYSNYLELRIYSPNKYSSKSAFLFTQWWPEQHIWMSTTNKVWDGEPIDYDPERIVNYNMQGVVRYFSFSPDLKRIDVAPNTKEDLFRWVYPESVTVDPGSNTIQVVNKRRLYTRTGVKDVIITTTYARFTMIT
ncbi:hypothetical protein GCM10027341_44430 [Spirosoma knui]